MRLSYHLNDDSNKFLRTSLCGVPLRVLKRSLRQKIDQDENVSYYNFKF